MAQTKPARLGRVRKENQQLRQALARHEREASVLRAALEQAHKAQARERARLSQQRDRAVQMLLDCTAPEQHLAVAQAVTKAGIVASPAEIILDAEYDRQRQERTREPGFDLGL